MTLGPAVDRTLASWVDTIWSKLRPRLSILGYSAKFYQKMDRVIWDVVEAELVVAADDVVRTDAHVCVHICRKESARHVFSPNVSLVFVVMVLPLVSCK